MIKLFISRNATANVRRLCTLLQVLIVVFLAAQLVTFPLSWAADGNYHLGFMRVRFWPDGLTPEELVSLGARERLIGIAFAVAPFGAICYASLQLLSLLRNIKTGMLFALGTIAYMQSFIGALLLYVVLANLERPLRAMCLNSVGSSHQLQVLFSLSPAELLLVVASTFFYVLTAIMHEGRRLEEENKGFV